MRHKKILSLVLTAAILSFMLDSCNHETHENSEKKEALTNADAEKEVLRGKYLVAILGCNDCHSPKRMGKNGPEIIPELMLSGYPSDRPIVKFNSPLIKEGFGMFYPDLTAAAGPWGISFAGNLTPDNTGLGPWSFENFRTAMTKGKFKGMENTRMLLPPMPWINYIDMKEEDLRAVFSYLKSIKPVKNIVPAPISPADM